MRAVRAAHRDRLQDPYDSLDPRFTLRQTIDEAVQATRPSERHIDGQNAAASPKADVAGAGLSHPVR